MATRLPLLRLPLLVVLLALSGLLLAGAAIYVAGVAPSLKAGIERARQAIESGAARRKLDEFIAFTRKLKA